MGTIVYINNWGVPRDMLAPVQAPPTWQQDPHLQHCHHQNHVFSRWSLMSLNLLKSFQVFFLQPGTGARIFFTVFPMVLEVPGLWEGLTTFARGFPLAMGKNLVLMMLVCGKHLGAPSALFTRHIRWDDEGALELPGLATLSSVLFECFGGGEDPTTLGALELLLPCPYMAPHVWPESACIKSFVLAYWARPGNLYLL